MTPGARPPRPGSPIRRLRAPEVVAEGIERPEQPHTLGDFGCPVGQGFLLGRPAPLAERAIHAEPMG